MEVHEESLRKLGVALLLFFGSGARGTSGPNSDTDIGVQFQPGAVDDLEALERVRMVLGGGDNLDLVNLNRASALLLHEAALDGIPRFESEPGLIERFRLRAHKRYMDTAKFRRLQRSALDSIYP